MAAVSCNCSKYDVSGL